VASFLVLLAQLWPNLGPFLAQANDIDALWPASWSCWPNSGPILAHQKSGALTAASKPDVTDLVVRYLTPPSF
jgi:hypothetical protein